MLSSETENSNGQEFILLSDSVKTFTCNLQTSHVIRTIPLLSQIISSGVLHRKTTLTFLLQENFKTEIQHKDESYKYFLNNLSA